MLTFDDDDWRNGRDWEGTGPQVTDLVIADIDRYATFLRDKLFDAKSFHESASFDRKAREARAYVLAPVDASAPNLAIEAAARGITTSALVTKVLNKVSRIENLEARIAGTAGFHQDAVKALSGRTNILAYDWRGGWPTA